MGRKYRNINIEEIVEDVRATATANYDAQEIPRYRQFITAGYVYQVQNSLRHCYHVGTLYEHVPNNDFQPQHSERLGQTQFRVLETYNVATSAHRLIPGHLSPMDFL
jgi:hypothetical protein